MSRIRILRAAVTYLIPFLVIIDPCAVAQTIDAAAISGANAFDQVQRAHNALFGSGVILATSFTGTQSTSNAGAATPLTISNSGVTVVWGSATFVLGISATVSSTINISGSNDQFICAKGGPVGTSGAAGTVFQYQTDTSQSGTATVISIAPGTYANGIVVHGCAVQGNRLQSGDIGKGADCLKVQDIMGGLLIEDLTLTNCGGNGIHVLNSDNYVIQRNYISQSSAPGIYLTSTAANPITGGVYPGQKTVRDNQLFDTSTQMGGGIYSINVGSAAYPLTQNVMVQNNVIANGVTDAFHNTNTNSNPCLGNNTLYATGCAGGMQFGSRVEGYEASGNVVRNTLAECISAGGSNFRVHHNTLSLCSVNSGGTVVAGSGGILYYVASDSGIQPPPATQGDAEIDNNLVTDSGYVFTVTLGNTNTVDNMIVQHVNFHDNHGRCLSVCTPPNQTLLVGILIRNLSNSMGGGCTSEPSNLCKWSITNSSFLDNGLRTTTTDR